MNIILYMKKLIILIGLVLCVLPSAVYANSSHHEDKLLVSNIPLAGIVQMITGDIFVIESIDTQNSCPHHYHAKPSDLLKLKNAKIAIYIDDAFESFFKDLLKKFDGEVLKMTNLIDINSASIAHEEEGEHDHVHADAKGAHHDHQHTDLTNYHIWVNLDLVSKLLPKIRDYFVGKYPEFKDLFDNNYQASIKKINELQKQKAEFLVQIPKLIVLSHSANAFFDGSSTDNKEIISLHIADYPSLHSINKLDEYMSSKDDICIITESSGGHLGTKDAKISALQSKYKKNVVGLNTEKWSLEDNTNYSDNFFKQYEGLLMELSKCAK